MTNTEKQKLIDLKLQGLGCNKISKITGVPLGTVKSFFRRNEIKEPEPVKGVCLECGSALSVVPGKKPRRFCSGTCWRRKKLRLMFDFVCPWCGKKFKAYGNDHRVYCSRECYAEARRKNGKLPEHFNV